MTGQGALAALVLAGLTLTPAPIAAQEGDQESPVLEVGQMAPDIELTGATRFGVLRDPVRLRDFRGQTIVLAFFFKARTPG
jgi:peroxiredoxin Q/BCP